MVRDGEDGRLMHDHGAEQLSRGGAQLLFFPQLLVQPLSLPAVLLALVQQIANISNTAHVHTARDINAVKADTWALEVHPAGRRDTEEEKSHVILSYDNVVQAPP